LQMHLIAWTSVKMVRSSISVLALLSSCRRNPLFHPSILIGISRAFVVVAND
jgi:hypothetical protein